MVLKGHKLVNYSDWFGRQSPVLVQTKIYRTVPLYDSHTAYMDSPLLPRDTQRGAFQSACVNEAVCD